MYVSKNISFLSDYTKIDDYNEAIRNAKVLSMSNNIKSFHVGYNGRTWDIFTYCDNANDIEFTFYKGEMNFNKYTY